MIDDVAEGVIRRVVGVILRFLFWLIVEILLFYTGETVLYIITLGRRRPARGAIVEKRPAGLWERTDLSVIIGLIFWFVVLAVAGRLLPG